MVGKEVNILIRKICMGLLLVMSTVSGYTVDQTFVGEGQWYTDSKLGYTNIEMAGIGDMSYASKGEVLDIGSISKIGLEFDGSRGAIKVAAVLGPELWYGFSAKNSTKISFRSTIDTVSSESTQDSNMGDLLLYSSYVHGQINGSMSEVISDGVIMGRPIEISDIGGTGNFTINSSLNLKEYVGGERK
jgi:hypothetical protein